MSCQGSSLPWGALLLGLVGKFSVEDSDTDMVLIASVAPRPTGCHARDRRCPRVRSCWDWMAWDRRGSGTSRRNGYG